jgi:hypothetical protein
MIAALGRLPLAFVANRGQVDERVSYYARARGQTFWLTRDGIVFDLVRASGGPPDPTLNTPGVVARGDPPRPVARERLVFTQELVGARSSLEMAPLKPAGIYNFFLGSDPSKWRTEVPAFDGVVYQEVWPGIDIALHGNGPSLEQEFVVKPGGDPSHIRVAYRGIDGLRLAADGSLLIQTAFGELRESPPRVYQEIGGRRVEVTGRFKLLSETAYAFEVGSYQRQYALVIDPTLLYSTYLGGTDFDFLPKIAVDVSGNSYVVGSTSSVDFPVVNAFQGVFGGGGPTGGDVFIAKVDPTGGLVYSTCLGGSSPERSGGIAVDTSGHAYVTGTTLSRDFPTASGQCLGAESVDRSARPRYAASSAGASSARPRRSHRRTELSRESSAR